MTWIKMSDDADTKQELDQVAELVDVLASPDIHDAFFGFVVKAYIIAARQCKGETPTYEVAKSALVSAYRGLKRTEELIELALQLKIFTEQFQRDGFTYIKLLEDEQWLNLFNPEKYRTKNDARDNDTIAHILLRDGSNCRWCGKFVYRRGSGSGGNNASNYRTIDHLRANYLPEEPTMPGEVVIACAKCNKSKQSPKTARQRFNIKNLLPAPERRNKVFHREAVEFFEEFGWKFLHFELIDGFDDRFRLSKTISRTETKMLEESDVGTPEEAVDLSHSSLSALRDPATSDVPAEDTDDILPVQETIPAQLRLGTPNVVVSKVDISRTGEVLEANKYKRRRRNRKEGDKIGEQKPQKIRDNLKSELRAKR